MATATLRLTGASAPPASTRKGFFARLLDRLIEARLRKAQAEILHYHRHLLPDELERKLGSLPFVR